MLPLALMLLPLDDLYSPYLAAPKEPRIGDVRIWDPDQGWLWDISLGGRGGLLRLTLPDVVFQLDLEGAAFVRLDLDDSRNLLSAEFKYGGHLFIGVGAVVFRIGYYHLSAHLGDEAQRMFPGRSPNSYSRDTLVGGVSFQTNEGLRIYAQIGVAVVVNGPAERFEIELGSEWLMPGGDLFGRPFAAIHAHLRQENHFGGNFVAQLGWHWRTKITGSTFRVGGHYYLGPSTHYQFYEMSEHQIGLGSWFDF